MFVLPRGILGTLRLVLDRFRPADAVPDASEGLPAETTLRHDKHELAAELVANGLTVRFGGLTALSNVSLRVKGGEIHALDRSQWCRQVHIRQHHLRILPSQRRPL